MVDNDMFIDTATANSMNDCFLDFLLTESDQYAIANNVVMEEEDDEPLADYYHHHDPTVPTHMRLDPSLDAAACHQIAHAPLERLEFGKVLAADIHTTTTTTTTLSEIIRRHNCPTVCLVMRRPGCPFCREDALELSRWWSTQQEQQKPDDETAKKEPAATPFHLMGIVKDTTSDVDGLHELATQYFPQPLYRDVGLATYSGLGNRTISWRQWLNLPAGTMRVRAKNIAYTMQGLNDTVQGGVLIFDAAGTLRYVHREIYADQLVMDDIKAAVRAVAAGAAVAVECHHDDDDEKKDHQ
jgi:hypothetical protein